MEKKKKRDEIKLEVLLLALFGCLMFWLYVISLAGCSNHTGWAVSFGVHPINAVDKLETLNQIQQKEEGKGALKNGTIR